MKKVNPEQKIFGDRLRSLRLRTGLSAESIAQNVGISPSTYREWENGRAITGIPYKKLASAYGVSLSHLFDDSVSHLEELHQAVQQIESAVKKIRTLF